MISKNNKKHRDTSGLARLLKQTLKTYKIQTILVVLLVIVSAIANVSGSLFTQRLIDDYIVPLTKQSTPNYTPLLFALGKLACIYIIGLIAILS